jgi:hypothetical protein
MDSEKNGRMVIPTVKPFRPSRAQWGLASLIAVLAVGKLTYHWLYAQRLEQTAALFVGLPAFLAIILALTPQARSAVGMILRGLTIAILLSGVLLGEGFICILMAAPLFYLVGIAVGLVVDSARRRRDAGGSRIVGLLLLPLLLSGLEGTHPRLSFSRPESVTVEKTLAAAATSVESSLAAAPSFSAPLPWFFTLGFPRPVGAWGSGLEIGDRRIVHFAAGRGLPGVLLLEVAGTSPGRVRFRILSDRTPIAHWLRWREAVIEWQSLGPEQTQVRWTLRYDRLLDPAWYFGPWERFGAGLAAEYLIHSAASP